MRRASYSTAIFMILFSVIGIFLFYAPHAFAAGITPGQDLNNAAFTGPSTVSNDAQLKQSLWVIEMWRLIAWLIMLLAGVAGAIFWAFGHRQLVLGVIGAAVILGGLFNFIATIGAQSPVGAGSQYFKVSSKPLSNPSLYHPSQQALLGQAAQVFADDGIRVMTTVLPLCMMAFGGVVVVGSVLHEGLLMRFLPGLIVGSLLMFANQTLATFLTAGVFPATPPNNAQLISIPVPADSSIGTYDGSVAPEPTAPAEGGSQAASSFSSGTPSNFNPGSGTLRGPQGGISPSGNMVTTNGTAKLDMDGDPNGTSDPNWQAHTAGGYNSAQTPFVVATQAEMAAGVKMGDWASITNNQTGQTIWAWVGDVGPAGQSGEISEAAADNLGITYQRNSSINGNPSLTIHMFPGTKDKPNAAGS